jgi:uncharacterized LabA/DUF88 family protein
MLKRHIVAGSEREGVPAGDARKEGHSMLKAMMFIDGSWFDAGIKTLCDREPGDGSGKQPRLYIENVEFDPIRVAVKEHIRSALEFEVDLVRIYCVAGCPDPKTVKEEYRRLAEKMEIGWLSLRRSACLSVDIYPYDYHNQPLSNGRPKTQRPKEKCVDVALATRMLYLAALPNAYDVAVLVSGDRDYVPVLRAVRELGKRTMLASFLNIDSCAKVFKEDASMGNLWDIPHLDLQAILEAQILAQPLP